VHCASVCADGLLEVFFRSATGGRQKCVAGTGSRGHPSAFRTSRLDWLGSRSSRISGHGFDSGAQLSWSYLPTKRADCTNYFIALSGLDTRSVTRAPEIWLFGPGPQPKTREAISTQLGRGP
jgi:hypothetical protein